MVEEDEMDKVSDQLLRDEFCAMLDELDRMGVEAPDGTVLDCLEGIVLDRGQELLRRALEAKVQGAIANAEKKRVPVAQVANKKRATKANARAR